MNKFNYRKNIFPLDQKKTLSFDMHVHSEFSSDCTSSVQDILNKARQIGIGVAITDHNEIQGAMKAHAIAAKMSVPFIPGIEVHCSEGIHVIFYFNTIKELQKFYQKVILPSKTKDPFERISLDFQNVVNKGDDYTCLVSIPHPFVKAFTGTRTVAKKRNLYEKVDLIEAINSCVRKRANEKALATAEENNLSIIGGSDAHFIFEIGTALTKCPVIDTKNFWECLKNKRSGASGRHANIIITLAVSMVKEFKLWMKCFKTGNLFFRCMVIIRTFLPYFSKKIQFKLPAPKI